MIIGVAGLVATAGLLAGCDDSTSTQASTHPVPGSSGASSSTLLPTPQDSPDDTVAVGAIAAGFPTDLLPVPDGAQILLTTNAPRSNTLREVSLSAKIPAAQMSTDQLLEIYRTSLTAAGFAEQPTQAASGVAASVAFVRGADGEIVTVTILTDGDQQNITAGGTVAVAGG